MADVQIAADWKALLETEFQEPYFQSLIQFLKQEKAAGKTVYPPGPAIFNAFAFTPVDKVKVVLLGQDPYHGAGQAHGLSFSVPQGIPAPPSLQNMFKELQSDCGLPIPNTGNLESWARQGVLLLNASLTVEAQRANSHAQIGWHLFTDAVIKAISDHCPAVVFLLWGRFAQSKATLIDGNKHLILMAAHPSPFSAYNGFFGCQHFSKANAWLISRGLAPVNWALG